MFVYVTIVQASQLKLDDSWFPISIYSKSLLQFKEHKNIATNIVALHFFQIPVHYLARWWFCGFFGVYLSNAFVLLGSIFLILFVSGWRNASQRSTLITLNLLCQKLVPSYSSIRIVQWKLAIFKAYYSYQELWTSFQLVILPKLSALCLIDEQFGDRPVSFVPRFCSDLQ